MVTGGFTGSDFLDTTEIFASDEGTWATAGARLPRPMNELRAATIDDHILIFGNYLIIFYSSHTRYHRNIIIAGGYDNDGYSYDDILEYNPKEDSMVTVGQMSQARCLHSVSVVQAQDFSVWCK